MEVTNQELQLIQSYCQNQGLTSLSLSDLQKTNTGNPDKTNYLPYIFGGVGLIVVIIGLVWLVMRNNKNKE